MTAASPVPNADEPAQPATGAEGKTSGVKRKGAKPGKKNGAKAASRPSDAFISSGLKRLVAKRHQDARTSSPEWALFYELRSGTGYSGPRTSYVDAFAFNLWPSKNHWRVAYELKASRADFLRELAKPEKRAWAMEIAHEFWYVAYPGVAKPEEIPQGCGLLVANEGLTKLRKVVHAPQREVRDLAMAEVAAFARKSQEERAALFQYAGRELTESDVELLLRSRTDAFFREEVNRVASAQVDDRLKGMEALLAGYARDMAAVGIEPPDWMREGGLSRALPWNERAWARQAFIEGPGLDRLLEHRRGLRSSAMQLDSLARHLEEMEKTTDELIRDRQASPSRRPESDTLGDSPESE